MTDMSEIIKISAIVVFAMLMRTAIAPASPLAQAAIEAPVEMTTGSTSAVAPASTTASVAADWSPAWFEAALEAPAADLARTSCGEKQVRVYDPFVGDYMWRNAEVCARQLP